MINPEREMLVCCAKVLLDLQKEMATENRKVIELVANALCTVAVANKKEMEFITDGQYKNIHHIEALLMYTGMDLIEAKRWVCDMLSREETPNEFLPKPPPPFETVEDLEE